MPAEPQYQPYCEDYHSGEESDGRVCESFTGRKSPNAANVSTKRSHPSDLDKEKPPAQERVPTNIDLRSDSGYSSLTAATVSSTNSAQSASSQRSPPVATATAAPLPSHNNTPPATKPRRPTQSEHRQNSANSSPRPKPPSRTVSQSSRPSTTQRRTTITQDRKPRRDSRADDCKDPNCTDCAPNALARSRRPELPPSQSAYNVLSYPSSEQRPMQPDHAAYYAAPPSPTHTRQSAYMQGPAVVQPAMPRRRSSSTTPQQRPMSYNGEPGQYWVPGMPAGYPSPPQEHGPPLSSSAGWRNQAQYQMHPMAPPMASYMGAHGQPTGYYSQYTPAQQTSPPYDGQQRPGLHSRNSSNYGTRNGPAPIITQQVREPLNNFSTRVQPQSATRANFPAPLQLQNAPYESSETESSSDEEEDYEPDPRDARALMPPPKIKRSKSKSQQQRPPMRHAKTTQVSDVDRAARRMSHSLVIDDRSGRASRVVNDAPRRKSRSRPAAPERRTQSDYVTPRAHVVVNNNSKPSRRQSAQVSEREYAAYAQARELDEVQARADARAQAKAHTKAQALAQAEEEAKLRAVELQMAQAKHEERFQREQKRKSRSKIQYKPPPEFDDSEEDEVEQIQVPVLREGRLRRPTESEGSRGKDRFVVPKSKRIENEAEDYISAQRGTRDSYADQVHKAAKPRMHSGRSHSGSSHSEGSDKQSQSNRTAVTSNGNEIRLRVDANAPLSLSFNGDMEGRTLRMIPAENGMADIVIGGSRGGESVYHGSERGSIASKRRSIMASDARRQAEEMTEKSSRSGHSRRDDRGVRESRNDREPQRQPLRRRTGTDYRN